MECQMCKVWEEGNDILSKENQRLRNRIVLLVSMNRRLLERVEEVKEGSDELFLGLCQYDPISQADGYSGEECTTQEAVKE